MNIFENDLFCPFKFFTIFDQQYFIVLNKFCWLNFSIMSYIFDGVLPSKLLDCNDLNSVNKPFKTIF